MTEFHILIIDEEIGDGFLGIKDYPHMSQDQGRARFHPEARPLLSNLPLWANFKVHDLITQCYPDNVPLTIFSFQEKDAAGRLIGLLNRRELGEHIILGRTGNITHIEWQNLVNRSVSHKGPLKIQVGKVPSDLYMVSRLYLRRVIEQWEQESVNLGKWLFDTHLFHNFERIVDVPGFSFLMRNSYEYYRENMRIFDYMRSDSFLDLYRRLMPSSLKSITVLENGVARDSILGAGVCVGGAVERSVVFSDVTIGGHAVIRDSVILTANIIEEDVRVENTLLLEGNGRVIGSRSVIGGEESVENDLYPNILKRGLTVVGRYIPVPPFSRIGAGCLVMGSENSLGNPILVEDGEVFNTEKEPAH